MDAAGGAAVDALFEICRLRPAVRAAAAVQVGGRCGRHHPFNAVYPNTPCPWWDLSTILCIPDGRTSRRAAVRRGPSRPTSAVRGPDCRRACSGASVACCRTSQRTRRSDCPGLLCDATAYRPSSSRCRRPCPAGNSFTTSTTVPCPLPAYRWRSVKPSPPSGRQTDRCSSWDSYPAERCIGHFL